MYDKIIKIVDANLILCLIPMIFTLILIELMFKNIFSTKKVLRIISWIILIYTLVIFLYFIIGFTVSPNEFSFIHRATGPYKTMYWIMFFSATIFPLTLLIKRLSSNFWYVLLVAFLMKVGVYFEHFVIVTTSIHRDYGPENQTSDLLNLWTYGILMVVLQGFVIVTLTLGILKICLVLKWVYTN